MRKWILACAAVLISAASFAQSTFPCGFDAVHQKARLKEKLYDSAVLSHDKQWKAYSALLSSAMLTYTSSGYVYEIPTVVHVLHTGDTVGSKYNPDSTKIAAMIDYLNKSYAATAPFADTLSGGVRIPLKFVLAKRTPTGAATNGIVRVDASSVSGYTTYGANAATSSGVDPSDIMALSRWTPSDYYNVYSVNKIDGNDLYSTGGIAGFAYFPGSPTYDGMIVAASQIKSGSTTVSHEFGHAFSLYHTFEGDSGGSSCPPTSSCSTTGDLVCDTEPHIRESSAFPSTWCPPTDVNPCTGGSYNNVQKNIMDYTNCPPDRFTAGQRTRVLFTLNNERTGFKSSYGLTAPSGTIATASCTPTTSFYFPIGPKIVDFNGINVWTGDAASEDAAYIDHAYTQQTKVKRGFVYPIAVTTTVNVQKVAVYVDYNNDGDFADAGESVYSHTGSTATEVHSGNITIPTTATTCQYLRMRVVATWAGETPSACGPYTYGQAEDYGMYVISDTPTATSPIAYCQGATAVALTATGSNLKWYTADTGGTGTSSLTPSTATAGSTTYYVTQSADASSTCESSRKPVTVNITTTPAAPSVVTPVTYALGATPSALTATRSSGSDTLYWYNTSAGGTGSKTAPTPSTASVGTTDYYVSERGPGGCESPRTLLQVTVVNTSCPSPGVAPVAYCLNAVASAVTATKPSPTDTLYWYTTATGGTGTRTAPTPSTASAGVSKYYVSARTSIGCESPRDSVIVTVNALPATPTVTTPINVCLGASMSALTATGTNLVWYTVATGGTGSSTAPTPSSATAGTTNYYVLDSNTTTTCVSARANIVVNVISTAKPTVTSPLTYCQNVAGSPLTATKGLPSDTLYWYGTRSGGTGTTLAPTPLTTVPGSLKFFVGAKNTLGCVSVRDSIIININAAPTKPTVGGPLTYCQGVTAAVLSATASATDTLYWYTTASGGTGSKTAPTPSTATAGTIAYYVGSKNTLGCESDRDSILVTVSAMAAKPTVTTPITYCQNATATILSASKGLATDTLYWYPLSTGGTGSTTAPTPLTTTTGTFTSYVSAKNIAGCESVRDSIKVIVNVLPTKPTVASPVSYCQNATAAALTATKGLGTDTVYWYSAASGGTSTITAPTPATTTAGTLTFYVGTVNTSGCVSARDSIKVNINPLATKPTVTTPVNYCQGATASALTATKGSPSDTLLWYNTATGGTGVTVAPTPSTASLGTTTYYVSAKTALNCESVRDSIVVIVNALAAKPTVTTPIAYCQNVTASALTANKSLLTDTLYWYNVPTGGTGSTTAPTPATTALGTFTFYVSAKSIAACESARDSIKVNVNALPTKPTVTTPVTYCQNATAAALSATKGLAVDTLYWYPSASGGTGSTATPTPVTTAAGLFTFYVGSKNPAGCVSTRDSIKVTVNALAAKPTVTTPVTYCQNATATALTATKGSPSDTLLWYTTASGGTGSTTAPTPLTTTAGTTTYYVSAKTAFNCESVRDSIKVTINALPAAPTVTSPVNLCIGVPASALTATGTSLLWYTTLLGGTGSATAPTPATTAAGTTPYYVSSTNTTTGCEGPRATISVVVNNLPTAPTVTTPVIYCQNATATALTATKGTASDTLYWYTALTGGTGTKTAPVPVTTTTGTSKTYVGSVSQYGCISNARTTIDVTINPTPVAPTVTSPVVYCKDVTTAAALVATGTDTLKWYTVATGGTASATAPTPSTTTAGTTTAYVSQKNSFACESPRAPITITITALPATPTITTPVTYCQGSTPVALTATGTSILWYAAATGGTGSATAPTPTTTTAGTTPYYVTQTDATTTCESPRATLNVVVNPLPAAPTVTTPVKLCNGGPTFALGATGTSLKWYATATSSTVIPTPIPSTATVGSTTYYVSQTTAVGCEGPRAGVTVDVQPTPTVVINPKSAPGYLYCAGKTLTLQAVSSTATSYQWYKGASTTGIVGATADTFVTGVTDSFKVIVKNSYGCPGSATVYVRQDTNTAPILSPADITICPGDLIVLSCHPAFTSSIFEWIKDGGTVVAPTLGFTTYSANAKGVYNVKVTNIYGCQYTTNSATINHYPTPVKPTIVRTDPVLSLSPSTWMFVRWFRNGAPISGATGKTYTFSSNGKYHAEVTDANGCTALSDTVNVTTTAINEPKTKLEIKIYPNPTNDRVTIDAPTPVNIRLTDLSGKLLLEEKNASQLHIGQLADGMYMLSIFDSENKLISIEKLSKIERP